MGHKKASATLIDDCIDKFRQHELEQKRLRLNGRQGSTENTPVEFFMGSEGDPLSAALKESTENQPQDVTGAGGKGTARAVLKNKSCFDGMIQGWAPVLLW